MPNKFIVIPILNTEYKTIVCWGDKKFVDKVGEDWGYKELISNFLTKRQRGITINSTKENLQPIIVLPKAPRTNSEIATLAHEAVHAVDIIYGFIQQENIDEVFAHSVGAIVRGVLSNR